MVDRERVVGAAAHQASEFMKQVLEEIATVAGFVLLVLALCFAVTMIGFLVVTVIGDLMAGRSIGQCIPYC